MQDEDQAMCGLRARDVFDGVSELPQHHGEHSRRVQIIVDDEDLPPIAVHFGHRSLPR